MDREEEQNEPEPLVLGWIGEIEMIGGLFLVMAYATVPSFIKSSTWLGFLAVFPSIVLTFGLLIFASRSEDQAVLSKRIRIVGFVLLCLVVLTHIACTYLRQHIHHIILSILQVLGNVSLFLALLYVFCRLMNCIADWVLVRWKRHRVFYRIAFFCLLAASVWLLSNLRSDLPKYPNGDPLFPWWVNILFLLFGFRMTAAVWTDKYGLFR